MRKKYTYILEAMDEIKLSVARLEQDVADIWQSIKNDNFERAGFEASNARAVAMHLRTTATMLYCDLTKMENVAVAKVKKNDEQ